MFLLVLMPLPVHAAATLVQQNNNDCVSCSPLSVSFPSNVASGDVVVVTVLVTSGTLNSIADTLLSSFTQTASFSSSFCSACYIYYATLTSSGADTINLTPTASTLMIGYVFEVSGVAAPPTVTAVSSGVGSSISTSSTAFQSGAFLLGTFIASPSFAPFSAGSGFTFSPSPPLPIASSLFEEYPISSVASPTTFPASQAGAGPFVDVGLVLNPAPTLQSQNIRSAYPYSQSSQ